MRLRPFLPDDFDSIKDWITDGRTHAMWCANLIKYPLERENFFSVMKEIGTRFGDAPFLATDDSGKPVSFFCYSLNLETNEGMLKFVMVNPEMRGQGYGRQMLRLVLDYAFSITKADAVQLNVFPENTGAKKCYEHAGFIERSTTPGAFAYKDEKWGRCNMVFKQSNNNL